MTQYIWMPPVCLDVPHMFRCTLYVWTSPYLWIPPVCLDDDWMPAVYI